MEMARLSLELGPEEIEQKSHFNLIEPLQTTSVILQRFRVITLISRPAAAAAFTAFAAFAVDSGVKSPADALHYKV
jgi:hypothetical protein